MSVQIKTNLGGLGYPAALANYTPMSFSLWVRFITFNGTSQPMFDMEDAVDSQFSAYMGNGTAGPHLMDMSTREAGTDFLFGPNVALGDWHCYQGAVNDASDGGVYGYIDSAQFFNTYTPIAVSGTVNINAVGAYGSGASWCNAYVSQCRVWTAKLTWEELAIERTSATHVKTANLYASWPLLTNLLDTSGNGRSLVPTGTISTDYAFDSSTEPPLFPRSLWLTR